MINSLPNLCAYQQEFLSARVFWHFIISSLPNLCAHQQEFDSILSSATCLISVCAHQQEFYGIVSSTMCTTSVFAYQHAILSLCGHPQVTATGGALGAWRAGVHCGRRGCQADHTQLARQVSETHTCGEFMLSLGVCSMCVYVLLCVCMCVCLC